MALFSTLNTIRTTPASVGNPTIQPATNAINYGPYISSTKPSSTLIKTPVASESSIIGLTGLTFQSDGSLLRTTTPSLTTLVQSVTTNRNFVLPAVTGNTNKVLPSYLTQYQPRFVHRPQSSDVLKTTSRKFEPYEILTGISQERPEIVMMTPFVPFYASKDSITKPSYIDIVESSGFNPSLSDAGLYADTQMNVRNLVVANVQRDLSRLSRLNHSIKKEYSDRKREVEKTIDTLQDISQFLLDAVQKSEMIQNQLDLRDDLHTVDSARLITSLSPVFSDVSLNSLSPYIRQYLPPQFSVADTLTKFGFQATNVKNFSSSKIWIQLMLEFKHLLLEHSLRFIDVEPVAQRNDKNATSITRSTTPRFTLASDDPVGIGSIESIIRTPALDLKNLIDAVTKAFQSIYQKGAHFKTDEARICGLANILSKEHKYSLGLSREPVRRALADYYGYGVNTGGAGNLTLFDDLVGKFGQNVSEFPQVNKNSLTSVAQQQPADNVAVLTFESKYLAGDNGTLTPGSTYYIDPVFRTSGRVFETETLTSLTSMLKSQHRNFSVIAVGLNIMSVANANPLSPNNNSISTYIDNPNDLTHFILRSIVDKNGNTLSTVRNDRLAGLFVLAQQNPAMRSLLFLYTLHKIFRSNELQSPINSINSNVVIEGLISGILALLDASVKESSTAFQILNSQGNFVDANDLDQDAIRNALKQGTVLTTFIETTMSQIYSAIRAVTISDRLIYSGQFNSVDMMVAFDLMTSMLSKFSNQRIVTKKSGGTSGNKKTIYIVAKGNVNHKNSINDISTRLSTEVALIHQTTYTVLNSLKNLSNSIDGFINYLQSPKAKSSLATITGMVPDIDLLQMMMSEQQIMMLGSGIADLAGKFKHSQVSSPYVDVDRDGDFDANDEVKLLDDSAVSPKLRNAIMGTFHAPEFVGTTAYNKRILTVGIPLGFVRRLKQLVNLKEQKQNSFVNKQSDIVQVVVYKVDLINQDLVFKPRRFLFELSRFPVRDDTTYKTLKTNPTFEEIMAAVPTRDWQESFEDGKQSISYWDAKSTSKNSKNALDSSTYDFLSTNQKAEIVKNHVMSHMLENYIKLTTGISVSEQTFDVVERPRSVETEFVRLLGEHQIQAVVDFSKLTPSTVSPLIGSVTTGNKFPTQNSIPTGGILFSSTIKTTLPSVNSVIKHNSVTRPQTTTAAGVAGNINFTTFSQTIENSVTSAPLTAQAKPLLGTASFLEAVGHRQIPALIGSLRSLHTFSKIQTSISNGALLAQQMLMPKQFDRVFNVIIDPDEFEIDYAVTTKTKFGKEALRQLIKRGDVVPGRTTVASRHLTVPASTSAFSKLTPGPTKGVSDPNMNNFLFRNRNKTEGDLIFEKYFVTIETFGEETV